MFDLSKEGIIGAPPTEAVVENAMQDTVDRNPSSMGAFSLSLNSVVIINSPFIYRIRNPAIASTTDMNILLLPTLAAAPVNGCTEAEGL